MKAARGSRRRLRRVGLQVPPPPLRGVLDAGMAVPAQPQTWPARNSLHGVRKYFIPTIFVVPYWFSADINYFGGLVGIKYLVPFFLHVFGAMCDTCDVLVGYKIFGFFSRKPRGERNGHWSG